MTNNETYVLQGDLACITITLVKEGELVSVNQLAPLGFSQSFTSLKLIGDNWLYHLGLELAGSLGTRVGFFKGSTTITSFRPSGKTLISKDRFMMSNRGPQTPLPLALNSL